MVIPFAIKLNEFVKSKKLLFNANKDYKLNELKYLVNCVSNENKVSSLYTKKGLLNWLYQNNTKYNYILIPKRYAAVYNCICLHIVSV